MLSARAAWSCRCSAAHGDEVESSATRRRDLHSNVNHSTWSDRTLCEPGVVPLRHFVGNVARITCTVSQRPCVSRLIRRMECSEVGRRARPHAGVHRCRGTHPGSKGKCQGKHHCEGCYRG